MKHLRQHHYLILLAAIVGLIASLLSLDLHYSSFSSFCTISEKINCDVVNRGPYSEILGVPIALLGVLGYAALILFVLFEPSLRDTLSFTDQDWWLYLVIITAAMLLFAIYLSMLEAFVIEAYCILCLTSQAAILVAFFAALREWRAAKAR